MSSFFRTLLGLEPADTAPPGADRRLVAAAALMVEAAQLDGRFGPDERRRIQALLVERFALDRATAEDLLGEAESEAEASVDWHGFTTAIKEGFDHDGRVDLIAMLWEIAYADGELHDYEASLLRRVAGLLYVSGPESALARERALARLGLTSAGADAPGP